MWNHGFNLVLMWRKQKQLLRTIDMKKLNGFLQTLYKQNLNKQNHRAHIRINLT